MTCLNASVVKLQQTPCHEIRQAFAACLARDEGRGPCRGLESKLQECAAKHVGRLDG